MVVDHFAPHHPSLICMLRFPISLFLFLLVSATYPSDQQVWLCGCDSARAFFSPRACCCRR